MADEILPNLLIQLPDVGADEDTWGNIVNDNYRLIDAKVVFKNVLGNVGIGVSTPLARLHVENTGSGESQVARFTRTNGADNAALRIDINPDTNTVSLDSTGAASGSLEIRRGSSLSAIFDATGNFGVGVLNPAYKINALGPIVATSGSINCGLSFSTRGEAGTLSNHNFGLIANNSTKCLVTTNDEFLVNCTSAPSPTVPGFGINVSDGFGDRCISVASNATAGDRVLAFFNPNGMVGSITIGGSSTAYNTSSDERLKENITEAEPTDSIIDSIQIRQFNWKSSGEHQRYGVIAQELDQIFPEAVSKSGTPEAMMGVDYSKLVPVLIKEIQSLRARVAQLEA